MFRTIRLRIHLLNKIKVKLQLSILNIFREIVKSHNASAYTVHQKLGTKYILIEGVFGWYACNMRLMLQLNITPILDGILFVLWKFRNTFIFVSRFYL